MARVEPAKHRMGRNLREAIEHLRGDIDRVEFWADAIDNFTKPVPEYDQTSSKLNQFSLGERIEGEGPASQSAQNVDAGGSISASKK